MIENAYWIPLLPLIGAALVGLLGPKMLRGASHWPVVLGVGGAAVMSFLLLGAVRNLDVSEYARTHVIYEWISTGQPDAPETSVSESAFNISFRIDSLTAIMLVTVCTIALLVVIYSRDYMRHHDNPERGYERFFAYLGLFVFSMASLVLAGNFLLLYLGWEAVGLCSYLLIGFYYAKPEAAAAAKKAFLVNRIGDFGFGVGILMIYLTFGSLDYETVFAAAGAMAEQDPSRITIIALLLFCGAVGKSAQIPLYVWLPDAMEGPSPVSALIHAATMVTAGVYMVARCGAIFAASTTAMTVVAVIGGVTAIFAATMALAQYDMKRILAYSTISQLGYMFLGLGVFAAGSAIFHLYTHAFFKALLFLGAGSVMHAMGGVIDVRQFGGLRKLLPVTYATFMIGGLALAGFPLLAGFWSKDEIIHAAMLHTPWLGYLAIVTAVLTAFYTFRMIFLAFFGQERVPAGVHVHESGRWMTVPLVLLAVGALFAGYANVSFRAGGFLGVFEPHGAMHGFLEPVLTPFAEHGGGHGDVAHADAAAHGEATGHGEEAGAHADHTLMYVSAALSILGILAAYFVYVVSPWLAASIRGAVPGLHNLLHHKYYVDEAYDAGVVKPLWKSGGFLFGVDRYFVDGLVWLATAVPRLIGFVMQTWQRGLLQGYGVAMVAGLGAMLLWVLFRS